MKRGHCPLAAAWVTGVTVTALMLGTVTQAQAQNGAEPDRIVTLDHPVAVQDAIQATAGTPLVELRLVAPGVIGGLLPTPGANPIDDAMWVQHAFGARFGTTPAVTEVVLTAGTSEEVVDSVRGALTRSPAAVAQPGKARSVPNSATGVPDERRQFGILAQDFDSHFPSAWEADTYRSNFSGSTKHATDNWFVYESAFGARPTDFPNDWGLELGVTIYNFSLSPAVRPFCGLDGGDSDTDFWAKTWNTAGALWGTNVPDAAAPYSDYNIQSDGCRNNSLELGVGFPRNLSQDVAYLLFSETNPGTRSSSVMSAAMAMLSNDCNDIGVSPNTNCMGLNTNRQPPAGFDKSQLLVNRDRNWTVPGCFLNADGLDAPIRIASGTPDCPAVLP